MFTNGGDADQDGYIVTVDAIDTAQVNTIGNVIFPRVASGRHEVTLSGVAANCLVTGGNSRSVRVGGDDNSQVTFEVDCATTGVTLVVSESGGDLDLDGYRLTVNGNEALAVFSDLPNLVSRLTAGSHTVTLGSVAPNCSVTGSNPREFSVSNRTVTTVTFVVECVAYTGVIEVNATTTGDDFDADGYRILVDGTRDHIVGNSGVIRISRLLPGTHAVAVTGIAANCMLAGAPTFQADVDVGDTTRIAVQVTCTRVERIAISRGSNADEYRILVVREDGTVEAILEDGLRPSWSPDGKRLVVERMLCGFYYYYCFGIGLFVLRTDGGAMTQLTDRGGAYDPDWSPDGGSIAFVDYVSSRSRIHVMNQDGSNVRVLPIDPQFLNATEPDWSPDASRIVFACLEAARSDICIMNADGTGVMRLTNDSFSDGSPVWSPDGTRIAFVTHRGGAFGSQLAVMNADGTGFRALGAGFDPTWSRDGNRIAFVNGSLGHGLYIINSDGTGMVRITVNPNDQWPAWRP